MEPILKVSGLTKTFSRQGQADFTAVKNISFDLFPDECLAIIGESGSGKTTAVNMIARLVDVTSGSTHLCSSSSVMPSSRFLQAYHTSSPSPRDAQRVSTTYIVRSGYFSRSSSAAMTADW